MALVVGATGLLGMEVCRVLKAAGHPLRALVRRTADATKRDEIASLGAELVEGDLKNADSLRRACAGVRAVISTASSTLSRQEGDSIETVDHLGQMALIDAAKAAGLEHFVFVSFRSRPQIQHPLAEAKQAVERHLKASGIPYTVLQASYFMEVWLTPMLGFDYAAGQVRIYGDGTNKISWVSYKDVARVAVAALRQPAARHAVVAVGGPEALSPREIVQLFEAAGARVTVEYVEEGQLRAQMNQATDPLQKSFAGLMLQYASGDAMDLTGTQKLFPIRLTSMRDYIAATLAATGSR
jgi:uncharacterized protein YbjT (DUF2867 family)